MDSDSDSPPTVPRAAVRRETISRRDSGSWSPSSLYMEHATHQLPTRPPPSSYTFPFQAFPGNPDPLPPRRRRSVDSNVEYTSLLEASVPPLKKPFAPFMADSAGSTSSLPRTDSSNSLYKASAAASAATPPSGATTTGIPGPSNASTHSFRAPFLSPASRPTSSFWAPPLPPSPSPSTAALAPYPGTPGSTTPALGASTKLQRTIAPSTRLPAPLEKTDKPWLASRPQRGLLSYFLTLACIFIGALGAAALCFFGVRSVPMLDDSSLCLVLSDDFTGSNGLDTSVWARDVFIGDEFQMFTNDDDNLFLRNGQLYLVPTITPDSTLSSGNFTLQGCTASLPNGRTNTSACIASAPGSSNPIPPIQSASLSTKGKKSIKFGRVEIKAKLPVGDWLWPRIRMVPVNDTYGPGLISGLMGVLEARGNGPMYAAQGNNFVRSSLTYGPLASVVKELFGWYSLKRSSFASQFHTYTLEWTPAFVRISIDSRIHATLLTQTPSASKSYYRKGKFPLTATNSSTGTVDAVPTEQEAYRGLGGGNSAPFDQDFYLQIALAAGGTSGWFPDGVGGKPWFDGEPRGRAIADFSSGRNGPVDGSEAGGGGTGSAGGRGWEGTWPQSEDTKGFRIDSVKMWNLCR